MISRYLLLLILLCVARIHPMAHYKRKAEQEHFTVESPAKKLSSLTQEELNAALLEAAERGDRAYMELLLNAGAVSDILYDKEITPLILAMRKNHLSCVELLIEGGADSTLGMPITSVWDYGKPFNESAIYVANTYLEPSPDDISLVCKGNREYIMPKRFTKLSQTLTDLLGASPDTTRIEVPLVDQDALRNLMGHIQKIIMLTVVIERENAGDWGMYEFDLAEDFVRDHEVADLIGMLKVANFLGITSVVDYVLPRAIVQKHLMQLGQQLAEAKINSRLISEIVDLVVGRVFSENEIVPRQ